MTYRVFISHGWHDRWIAKQMARAISDSGATPFIDIFDIKRGDRIGAKVHEGLTKSDELVALLTPWSVIEIGFGLRSLPPGRCASATQECYMD